MARSYHDVVVIIDGVRYPIKDNYSYVLSCTKVGGWNLYNKWNGKETLIGGEFESDSFQIEVDNIIICGED